MLPDFPALKRDLASRLIHSAQSVAHDDPVLGMMPEFRIHEGHRAKVRRRNDRDAEITFDDPIRASVIIDVDAIRRDGGRAAIEAMRQTGDELAGAMARRTYAAIQEATTAIGNTLDAKGKPVTADDMLQLLEKMEHTFDTRGNWERPSIVAHPDTAAKLERALTMLNDDPAYQAKLEALVARKREEWHAREARRTLAD